MINDDFEIKYPIDVMHVNKFAELIGKTPRAIKQMIQDKKLPVVNLQSPQHAKVGERWIYIPEFNRGIKEAYFERPTEERNAWTKWFKKQSQ